MLKNQSKVVVFQNSAQFCRRFSSKIVHYFGMCIIYLFQNAFFRKLCTILESLVGDFPKIVHYFGTPLYDIYMFQRLRNYLDIYRHTEYPWSDTGRTAECTEWKEFETKCPNAQINMKFCQQVCEHPNAKDIIGHFLRKAKRITSIELARQDVKRFNHYDYYNMRGSPRGSQILIRKFID